MSDENPYAKASCREHDPEMFFPVAPKREAGPAWDKYMIAVKEAKGVCAGCPVRTRCLDENLYEGDGIFGGMTFGQRKRLRSARGIWATGHRGSTPSYERRTA